jgi:hypothetical protein
MPNQLSTGPNYYEQLQDLTPVEQQGVNAFLKSANEDSRMNVFQAVKNYRTLMTNEYECPPIGVRKKIFKNCFNFIYRLQQFVERMEVELNFIHPWINIDKL